MNIRAIAEAILELLYPTRAKCLGCGDERGCDEPFLCEECRNLLRPVQILTVRNEWKERGLESAAFVYYYGRPIKGLIRSFKFHSVRILAGSMAQDMAELIKEKAAGDCDMMIPVPLHPARLRERGFNQAEVLARALAEKCGMEMRTDILDRIRRTKQQAKLSGIRRMGNTEGAFRAKKDLTGRRVLLVDDVVTTGSTLCACAEALKKAGAREVHAVALAGSRRYRQCGWHVYRSKEKVNRR